MTTSGVLTIGNWSQALSYRLDSPNFQSTPAAFAFGDVVGAEGETRIVSSTVIPAGYNVPVRALVSGDGDPMLSVDGGPFTRESMRIAPGQALRVSLTSGRGDGSTRRAAVSIGTTSTTWAVTTANTAAEPFVLTSSTDVAPGSSVGSSEVVVGGLGVGQVTATVSGDGSPTLSVNGGVQRTSAIVGNGNRIRLSATSPDGFETTGRAVLAVGSTRGTWTVTTRARSSMPAPFSISPVIGAAPGTLVESAAISPGGFLDDAEVAVTGGEVSINGGAWAPSGVISAGETFVLRATAPSAPGASINVDINIGGRTAVWSVGT